MHETNEKRECLSKEMACLGKEIKDIKYHPSKILELNKIFKIYLMNSLNRRMEETEK